MSKSRMYGIRRQPANNRRADERMNAKAYFRRKAVADKHSVHIREVREFLENAPQERKEE